MLTSTSIAALLGLNPSQFAALLQVPATLRKINTWTEATHNETFWYGEAKFNTNYRLSGWGWVFMKSPFPGTVQFWVTRLPSEPNSSKRFALNPSVDLP